MIEIFQGTLGSGKSASMVHDMINHLQSGGVVACNFSLVDDWAERLCNMSIWSNFRSLERNQAIIDSYRRRLRIVQTVDQIWDASDTLIPLAEGLWKEKREGRGRLYLDECQLVFNSRDWNKKNSDGGPSDNSRWIHFFSQSRKLRWDIILIAHNVNMIDKQIRPFIEFETRFRNMSKVKFLGVLPMAPESRPVFLAITRYAGISAGAGEISKRTLYPLVPAIADLYDSALVFGRPGVTSDTPLPSYPSSRSSSAVLVPDRVRLPVPGPRPRGTVTCHI